MKNLTLLLPILFLCGCTTPGYFSDRVRDGVDILTLTVGPGLGAKVSAGPLYVNLFGIWHRDIAGFRYGDLVAPSANSEDSEIGSWFGWGQSYHTLTNLQERRGKAPEHLFTDIPFFMTRKRGDDADPLAMDCVIGLVGSLRFGFSPLEFADFVFGWTTWDILGDDLPPSTDAEEAEEAEEDEGGARHQREE